jgi:glycyl-tRNA synthetase beta chain
MSNFLLEIGTEELPADFVDSALSQWKEKIPQSLSEEFLHPKKIEFYGTPRRLALLIQGLPAQQADREEEIKGPPASAAFKNGKPTPAAEGFARKQGVELSDLKVRPTDKGDFVFINKKIPGKPVEEILTALGPKWISELEGRRFMRWGDGDLRFPRPIRTLIALLDDQVLPLELVNGSNSVKSDRLSLGHRVLHPEPVTITEASAYQECLRAAFIEVDPETRKATIGKQIVETATKIGGFADIPNDLLEEVVNLVESPNAVLGEFDRDFLKLPSEVITTVMVTHQRYFPIKKTDDRQSELFPNFITISNGDPNKAAIIAAGNARVIRARLADAQFFYKADCAKSLESYLPQLATVTFQEELGSIKDKVDRIVKIALQICDQLNLDVNVTKIIERTALLCKADLVTQMVFEFPELQGIMGEKYAVVSGESKEVATGIFEHYLPRNVGDILPESLAGRVVGIADRLDTLVSIFGLGMLPSGSSDPFALRRAANAIVNIIWNGKLGINLAQLLQVNAADFVKVHINKESPLVFLKDFFEQRIQTLLEDDLSIDYDLVNAVLGEEDLEYRDRALNDLLDVRDRALFLQEIRNNGELAKIYETVNRSTRLAAKGELNRQELEVKNAIDAELFQKDCERDFYQNLIELVPQTQAAQTNRNYQLLVDGLAKISPVVSNFFDGPDSVLVMDENPNIQTNRLNLLGVLRNHARILADFGAIVK